MVSASISRQALAQESSSSQNPANQSSSRTEGRAVDNGPQVGRARVAAVEATGSAVTLETNESLFQVAAALNACGYDYGLAKSEPVRNEVRADMQQAVAASEPARASRDALCDYIVQHKLTDPGRNLAQYVSLSLYLSPSPEMTPNVSELELPPDSTQVVNVLPLLRAFAEAIDLHGIWLRRRAEYEALVDKVHDPMTKAVLDTNIYLHQPVSSYDGRRFIVLLEPMLAPDETNARIYASDYIVVTSPSPSPALPQEVRLDLIRHTYLHYVIEPMVYSRAAAMDHLLPLLRPVQEAPIEFQFKSDITALLTECLIKAVEARMFVIDTPKPERPKTVHVRADLEQYNAEMLVYDRETEVARLKMVDDDMDHGWTLTQYFTEQLIKMEKNGDGLRDEIAPMVYGMDVDREQHRDAQILFVKEQSFDVLRSSPRATAPLTNSQQAEVKLAKGDRVGAAALAEKALDDPNEDHGRAEYVLAEIDLVSGEMDLAMSGFTAALKDSHDPRTKAWSHIYLGRLYDSMAEPHRNEAIAEYKAALAVRDARADTREAAEAGIKAPFAPPRRSASAPSDDDANFDPTGKKEKEEYQPPPPALPAAGSPH